MLASATSCADTAGGPELMVGLAKSVFSSMTRDRGRLVLLAFFSRIGGGGPPSFSSCSENQKSLHDEGLKVYDC